MSQHINENNMILSDSTESRAHILNLLETSINNHLAIGYLIFEVFQKSPFQGILPITNATITLTKELGEGYRITKTLTTDNNGKTKPLSLPTFPAILSLDPDNQEVFSTYQAIVEAPGFSPSKTIDIPIFEEITTLQPVNLLVDYELISLPTPLEKEQSQ